MRVLLSFVGNHDPVGGPDEDSGPVLSLLGARPFERAILYCTGPDYFERARSVEELAKERGIATSFQFVSLELESVIDYEEIYPKLRDLTSRACGHLAGLGPEYWVLLDPGTPQMQTSWFLLAKSGVLDARLLQGIPARFAGGTYRCREVNLESSVLPTVTVPSAAGAPGGPGGAAQASAAAPPAAQAVPPATRGAAPRMADLLAPPPECEEGRWIVAGMSPFVAEHPAVREVFETAARVAPYDSSVLIRGETGTGKEVLARFIHSSSRRCSGPFLPVNCAALSRELVESELFGHVRGAFTGAERERLGVFRAADGGTVLLDEVGDLPLELQPKLLRVLEQRRFMPVGADREAECDIRVLAATNKDLEVLVEEGRFRQDLYERLDQVTLVTPPLRERREDILRLAVFFLEEWNRKYREERSLTPETERIFRGYAWPGNVRELRNAIETMCSTARGNELLPEFLPPRVAGRMATAAALARSRPQIPATGMNLRDYLFGIERAYFEEALERAEGNGEKAAELLGIQGPAFRKAWRERFARGE